MPKKLGRIQSKVYTINKNLLNSLNNIILKVYFSLETISFDKHIILLFTHVCFLKYERYANVFHCENSGERAQVHPILTREQTAYLPGYYIKQYEFHIKSILKIILQFFYHLLSNSFIETEHMIH